MKIVTISDTHNYHNSMYSDIPDGDVLIHAGDFTSVGHVHELMGFLKWFRKLPHKYKIFIAGNHDKCFDKKFQGVKYTHDDIMNVLTEYDVNMPGSNIFYLQDSEVIINGIKFYGSPWTPDFFAEYWAFNLPRNEKIRAAWDMIPDDTNVLITHGPPRNILDLVNNNFSETQNVGCDFLLRRVENLPNLKAHIFGHIHSGYGSKTYMNKLFLNPSICNEDYVPINLPLTFEI